LVLPGYERHTQCCGVLVADGLPYSSGKDILGDRREAN
jgi:hypothetical protein